MPNSTVIARLRAGGIVDPRTTVVEARRAGLPLPFACALLEKESGGGRNVFGHDPTIFVGAGPVTSEKYRAYLARRRGSGNRLMQGVGPCQLTWWEFQDAADREGGCWRPEVNMRVGFRHLAQLISRYGAADGARRYNGSGEAAVAYSRDLLARARAWERRLAGAPAAAAGAARVPAATARVLRRGDEGERVRRLTRRLSYVPSRETRETYLDGSRDRFDAETERALEDFQREHGLEADGVYGELSARKLARAVQREKARRQDAGERPRPERPERPERPRPQRVASGAGDDVAALVDRALRAAALSRRADVRLVAESGRLRRAVREQREREPAGSGASRTEAILLRIDRKLGKLVSLEMADDAPAGVAGPEARPAAAVATEEGAEQREAATMDAGTITRTPLPSSVEAGGSPPPDTPKDPPRDLPARDLSLRDLAHRVKDLSDALAEARGELVERVRRLDGDLGGPRRRGERAADRPRGDRGAAERDRESRNGGGPGDAPVSKGRPERRPRPPAKGHATAKERDPRGGAVVDVKLGDQGHVVRCSKIAIARYLGSKGNQEHAALKRALMREARSRKLGRVATTRWRQGVRAVQHLSRKPVTGVLDGDLRAVLEAHWPRDSAVRRVVRSTPAFRAIPGQVSPNFNLREFGCNDGTPYVAGLVREQNLTKKQAKARGRALANRLERVRKADGDRALVITSAFRSKAHNAATPGAVPNSSHTRGFAVDVPPPAGVTIERHRQNMRAAFERGCGFYPPGKGNFVHGDFDDQFPRRDW